MSAILGKVQIGKETTRGTAAAATKLLPMVQGQMSPDRKVKELSYDTGHNVDTNGHIQQGVLVEDSLSFDHGFFELLPILLSGCVNGGVVPIEKNVGKGDYDWLFQPALDDTDNAQDSFTLERGDNVSAYKSAYTMFKNLKISAQISQDGGESPVKISADYFGRQYVAGSFTALSAAMPTTWLNGKLIQVFFDNAFDDIGETEISDFLRAIDIEIVGGLQPAFYGGSNEYFNEHQQGPLGILTTLTVKRGSASEAIRAAIGLGRALRVKFNGPQISTGAHNLFQLDQWAYIDNPVAMAQNDRMKSANLDTFILHGELEPVLESMFNAEVICGLASL